MLGRIIALTILQYSCRKYIIRTLLATHTHTHVGVSSAICRHAWLPHRLSQIIIILPSHPLRVCRLPALYYLCGRTKRRLNMRSMFENINTSARAKQTQIILFQFKKSDEDNFVRISGWPMSLSSRYGRRPTKRNILYNHSYEYIPSD